MNQSIDLNIELIERCKRGDIKAQFNLYKRYSTAMYNIAIRFLNNKMDTEDIFINGIQLLCIILLSDFLITKWIRKIYCRNHLLLYLED